MKRLAIKGILINAIKVTAIFLIVMVAGLWIVQAFYKDDVTEYIKQKVNEQLASEVQVGSFDFSLFSHFPRGSVIFRNVFVPDVENPHGIDTLFSARSIWLQFSLIDLLKKDKKLSRVEVREGQVVLRFFKGGRTNFQLLKEDREGTNQLLLDLERIVLRDALIRVWYEDPLQDYRLFTPALVIKGNIRKDLLEFRARGGTESRYFRIVDLLFPTGVEIDIDARMSVDLADREYALLPSTLTINGDRLDVEGVMLDKLQQLQIRVSGEELSVQRGLRVLPASLTGLLPEYRKLDAAFAATCGISGSYARGDIPAVVVDFDLEPAEDWDIDGLPLFSTGRVTGSLFYNDAVMPEDYILNITELLVFNQQDTVEGSIRIDSWTRPSLRGELRGRIHPGAYPDILKATQADTISGIVTFRSELSLGPAHPDSILTSLNTFRGQTKLWLAGMAYSSREQDLHIEHLTGEILLNDTRVDAFDLSMRLPQGDVRVKGRAEGLLTLADDSPALSADIDVSSPRIDLRSKENRGVAGSLPIMPAGWQVSARLLVDSLITDDMRVSGIRARAELAQGVLYFSGIHAAVFDGNVSGRGNIDLRTGASHGMFFDIETSDVDIAGLFSGMNDFGQTSITHRNLSGKITTSTRMTGTMAADGSFLSDSLIATSHLLVKEGMLFDFQPLESIARFLRISELERISFSTLENDIDIRNNQVIIPKMRIVSDVASMNISGVQDFDGTMDYHISMNINQLMVSKARRNAMNLQGDPDQQGGMTIYLHLTGMPDNPQVGWDRREAMEQLSKDLNNQKNQVKTILHEEFGLFRKNVPVKKDTIVKQKNTYTLEWDDE